MTTRTKVSLWAVTVAATLLVMTWTTGAIPMWNRVWTLLGARWFLLLIPIALLGIDVRFKLHASGHLPLDTRADMALGALVFSLVHSANGFIRAYTSPSIETFTSAEVLQLALAVLVIIAQLIVWFEILLTLKKFEQAAGQNPPLERLLGSYARAAAWFIFSGGLTLWFVA